MGALSCSSLAQILNSQSSIVSGILRTQVPSTARVLVSFDVLKLYSPVALYLTCQCSTCRLGATFRAVDNQNWHRGALSIKLQILDESSSGLLRPYHSTSFNSTAIPVSSRSTLM
ncbi:hypothetical protein LY78DRAFT_434781 [Colletotrichum sublineola]|nr:hypothetical protein LY78DRAFT_434781 [Colletotrichum sublineola]